MREKSDLLELISEIDKTLSITQKNYSFHGDFHKRFIETQGKETAFAMTLSQIFIDLYTCLETLFLRISQVFENNLSKEPWHKSLLHKMNLDIRDVRIAVIQDQTYRLLEEVLRFRHFRRYYFDFDYDWDRLELINKKYIALEGLIIRDLRDFQKFLMETVQAID